MENQDMAMGACSHEQVGYRKGSTTIFCCPEAHGDVFRRILEGKGFEETTERKVIR